MNLRDIMGKEKPFLTLKQAEESLRPFGIKRFPGFERDSSERDPNAYEVKVRNLEKTPFVRDGKSYLHITAEYSLQYNLSSKDSAGQFLPSRKVEHHKVDVNVEINPGFPYDIPY